jgi:hypothetical protein
MTDIGRQLLITGVLIVLAGLALMLAGRIPGIGRLPGDIVVSKGNFTFMFPVVTMLLVSVVLTVVLNLLLRWW